MQSLTKPTRLVRAATLVLLASASSFAMVPLTVAPAMAQVTGSDLTTIEKGVTDAIDQAKASVGPGASQAQIDAAISSALTTETETLIAQLSADGVENVAESIIAVAQNHSVPQSVIGVALADAALFEGATNGTPIADALRDTGTRAAKDAFETTADNGTDLGTALADDAEGKKPVVVGGSGNTPPPVTVNGPTGGGGGGGGCTNPSCT